LGECESDKPRECSEGQMRITVNRALRGGVYYVGFRVGEFTDEEREKMERFGVPTIAMFVGGPASRVQTLVALNQVIPNRPAGFATEAEAKAYEGRVLNDVRKMMESLRERKDDFTSAEEVNI
jgi:hypothetical protein